jgi:hypothetical protein
MIAVAGLRAMNGRRYTTGPTCRERRSWLKGPLMNLPYAGGVSARAA